MVITKPNKFVAEIHDRMPVIRAREHGEPKDAAALVKPAAEDISSAGRSPGASTAPKRQRMLPPLAVRTRPEVLDTFLGRTSEVHRNKY
jgi:putative SOS response-associated peptidase YedK